MVTNERGAELRARTVKPSIDLATLVSLIAKAIPTEASSEQAASPDPKLRSAFLFDPAKKRLQICTSTVLRRLFAQSNFRKAFDPSKGGGFIRDISNPPFGVRSRIGGCLAEGNPERLTTEVDALIAAIDQAIKGALPSDVALSSLLLSEPEQQLQQLAKRAGASFKRQSNSANLTSLAFKPEATVTQKDAAVAKVISAIERIDASDYFERMCNAVREYLTQRDEDEEDIEAAIDTLAAEQARIDSQITRFLNFLDDEALSRVRLTIAFQIMETIADNAQTLNQAQHQLLVEYIRRAVRLLDTAKSTGYTVDLTAHYGAAAEFDLLDFLSKATFYSCLPVWAEWKTQIFEEKVRNQTATSYGVKRQVSYRFRVNGQRLEINKSAFEGRLDDIAAELEDWEAQSEAQPGRFRRRLAELIFLAIVVPQPQPSATELDLPQIVQNLLARLRSGGKEAVREVLQDLRDRIPVMDAIATALIAVLRNKSQKILTQVQRRSSQQFVCVKRSIIEWSRLEGAEPGVRDLLASASAQSREQIEWFKHIEVCDTPTVPGLLFSVSVATEISEHSLVAQEEATTLKAQRLFPSQLLQICWVPYTHKKEEAQWIYERVKSVEAARGWALPASINVEYDAATLKRQSGNKQAEENKQFHAAAIAAFTVFVYCCLWRITQQLKQSGETAVEFTSLMLRLQETGKSTDEGNGDSYIYAAAQAIEAMLGQDLNIRMQGIALDNLTQQNSSTRFIKTGIFDALLSVFPIAVSTPTVPAVPKIGLISYATRPCDEQPALINDEKGHLLLTQSYTATAIEHPFPGYKLQPERKQADIVDTPEQLKKQRLVQEEIGYLKSQGCQHIILLSHSYGDRHINRTADYNSLLTPKEFLKEISETFSDLTIYTMLRDVFPATRLHRRTPNQAAFEILRTSDHTTFLQDVDTVRVRDIIPVYTFATLYVVEEAKRPQSGFCVYFLVSDQRVDNFNWTERPRRHLLDADQQSDIHPCLISILRGLHFIEAERGVKGGQLLPVLDPFSWISPNTIEAAGEVEIMHSRRKGKVLLNYPALLCHIARVLHRRK